MTPSKTSFAGYERLAPGDPLSSDGFAFQFENPAIADRLDRIGAITHRHDAHAAMADPTTAATVTTAATGGAIPSNTAIHVAYTLTDPDGGETLPTTPIVVTTAAGYLTPASPPTAAADYTAGTLLANTYLYAVTVTDGAGGETALGPAVVLTIAPGHANARALITGLTAITNTASGGASSAGWRLWRSVDGGSSWDLMATGAHGTDTFTDTGASGGDCTVSPPNTGTTVGTNKLTVTVPATGQPAGATFFSIYASVDGQFIAPSLLGTYPVADYGVAKNYTALTLLNGQPPAVSQAYPGANKIDPVTDLDTPGAPTTGQVLTATSSSAAAWQAPSGGGGGGSVPGVHRITGPTGTTITASATTNVTITVPAFSEGGIRRIVVALLIEHPDASQLAASINDGGTPVRLFVAGSFLSDTNIGDPTAATDPDAFVYFTDWVRQVVTGPGDQDGAVDREPLTATSAARPYAYADNPYRPVDPLSGLAGHTIGDLTLSITESGGSAGTLHGVNVYYVSDEFDALLRVQPAGVKAIYDASSSVTLADYMQGALVRATAAGATTLTIPANVFPVGTVIDFLQVGAGTPTFAAGGGVTLHSHGGLVSSGGQWAEQRLVQYDTNAWALSGDRA